VVSVTDLYGHDLSFLHRSLYFIFQVASQFMQWNTANADSTMRSLQILPLILRYERL
jgi:hypothetical protein